MEEQRGSNSQRTLVRSNGHRAVVIPPTDLIVMLGGSGLVNDVWQSTDGGTSWHEITSNAGWSARSEPAVVVVPSTSDVLVMGGWDGSPLNDVWRSCSGGWVTINPSPPNDAWTTCSLCPAGWYGRSYSFSILPSTCQQCPAGGQYPWVHGMLFAAPARADLHCGRDTGAGSVSRPAHRAICVDLR